MKIQNESKIVYCLYDESFSLFSFCVFSHQRIDKTLSILRVLFFCAQIQCQIKSKFYLSVCFVDYLFRFDALPERVFRAKLRVTGGEDWTIELADQSSLRFQHRAKFYEDAINQMMNRSDLRDGFKRSEVLALDG